MRAAQLSLVPISGTQLTTSSSPPPDIADRLQTSLAQLRGVPVIQMSGLYKRGLGTLLAAAEEVYDLWNTRISTGRLNRWLDLMLEAHPPPLVEGRRMRIRYITQIKIRPPTFALFVSRLQFAGELFALSDDRSASGFWLYAAFRSGW